MTSIMRGSVVLCVTSWRDSVSWCCGFWDYCCWDYCCCIWYVIVVAVIKIIVVYSLTILFVVNNIVVVVVSHLFFEVVVILLSGWIFVYCVDYKFMKYHHKVPHNIIKNEWSQTPQIQITPLPKTSIPLPNTQIINNSIFLSFQMPVWRSDSLILQQDQRFWVLQRWHQIQVLWNMLRL